MSTLRVSLASWLTKLHHVFYRESERLMLRHASDRWVDLGIWSAIEPTIGITVASLATCKPLFLRITDGLSTRIQSSRWTIASTTKHGIRIPIPIVKASPKPDDKGLRPVKNHIQGRWPITAEGGKRAVQDDELSRHWFSEIPA